MEVNSNFDNLSGLINQEKNESSANESDSIIFDWESKFQK